MSVVKDALVADLQATVQQSLRYAEKQKRAKTSAKRKFYTKKLEKNNKHVDQILQSIERVENKNNYESDNTNDTSV